MTSRDNILKRLRAARAPFADLPPITERRAVAVVPDESPAALLARFVDAATALKCVVHVCDDESDAVQAVLDVLRGDASVTSWALDALPLAGFGAALQAANIIVTPAGDPEVRSARMARAKCTS